MKTKKILFEENKLKTFDETINESIEKRIISLQHREENIFSFDKNNQFCSYESFSRFHAEKDTDTMKFQNGTKKTKPLKRPFLGKLAELLNRE